LKSYFCGMDKPVLILGAKGIAKAAMEIFLSHNVAVYGFLDDDESLHGSDINHIPILGQTEDDGYLKLIGKKCEAFVAVEDPQLRKGLVKLLNERRKVMPTNAIHSNAIIADSAHLGYGNFINAGATVGAEAKVPNHCILHSSAVIEHEVILGDFVQIGAGSVINSGVEIAEGAFIGSGVTIVSGVKIGKKARIGAGSVVIADVKAGETVFGNPAVAVKS